MLPVLYIVIPCYNEEKALPLTAPVFSNKLNELSKAEKISSESRVLFIDDGSRDSTWNIIEKLSSKNEHFKGIKLSRNFGHQNALLAGLVHAQSRCDITISIDCDGQDDINAVDKMVDEYLNGADIVYGVRSSRKADTFFKCSTAQGFYRLLRRLGADVVYNHADYRLISSRVLKELLNFHEANIFLRGMIPLVGFKSTCVTYERKERIAGKSHYSFGKMFGLAINGITSLSTKPLRIITGFGIAVAMLSFAGIIWSVISHLLDHTVAGWASIVSIICFLSGIQLLSLGIIGEYVGKIYIEAKQRPRYIVEKSISEQDKKII